MSRADIQISKFLSYVLRHAPEAASLTLDSEGWAEIDPLLEAARRENLKLDRATLLELVEQSDKKRFTLSADGLRIRAAQGHSTPQVNMSHVAVEPPPVLYHGTARTNIPSIMERGLVAGRRHYVHLSPDEETATRVGRRHGAPAILQVDALQMHENGLAFYLSENGVWLTRSVPTQFIRL
jgi:putative RNA 2'-phosphotransferase